LVFAGVSLACCAAPSLNHPPTRARFFEIEGHRGARSARPENSLSAFRYALAEGADTLEMDLHSTRDGVLVVTHDPKIDPELCRDALGNRPRPGILVYSLTLAELQSYDCGSIQNSKFPYQVVQPGERIPTYESVLAWLASDPSPRAKKIRLNVETKSEERHPEYTPPPREFTAAILAMTKKYGLFSRMILESFDYRTLRIAREIDPSTVLSVLTRDRPRTTYAELGSELHAQIISPDYRWLTGVDVESLHVLGMKVVPWTVDSEREWRRLANIGVEGIISDDPHALFEFRRLYFENSGVE
jgi:glycerophosphoryl diester phosphodiesterase